mmetsp:Transcript_35786/g.83297  ORF Transcript_35786/g.83297 Transcript_35786/m.83297 type:complete len:99 (+) Transcript_35786:3054-3350(+)
MASWVLRASLHAEGLLEKEDRRATAAGTPERVKGSFGADFCLESPIFLFREVMFLRVIYRGTKLLETRVGSQGKDETDDKTKDKINEHIRILMESLCT